MMKLTLSEFKRLSPDDQKDYIGAGMEILEDPAKERLVSSDPEPQKAVPALMTRQTFGKLERLAQSEYILAHGTVFIEADNAFGEGNASESSKNQKSESSALGCLICGGCVLLPIIGPVYCLMTVADSKKRQSGLTALAISLIAFVFWIIIL